MFLNEIKPFSQKLPVELNSYVIILFGVIHAKSVSSQNHSRNARYLNKEFIITNVEYWINLAGVKFWTNKSKIFETSSPNFLSIIEFNQLFVLASIFSLLNVVL